MKSKSPQPYLRTRGQGTTISVSVQPNAPKTIIKGLHGDSLKILLQAPPVDGKANDALIVFLAKHLGLKQNDVTILSGETGRKKVIWVNLPIDQVAAKLL